MSTFKVLFDKRRKLSDGSYPLVVRIFNGRSFLFRLCWWGLSLLLFKRIT